MAGRSRVTRPPNRPPAGLALSSLGPSSAQGGPGSAQPCARAWLFLPGTQIHKGKVCALVGSAHQRHFMFFLKLTYMYFPCFLQGVFTILVFFLIA